MLAINNLREISAARLYDAKILYVAQRFDGAYYLCGYCVELALKVRICKSLKWSGFPETNKEFERFSSFKVHDLDVLLKLSGYEGVIKGTYFSEWSTVMAWRPEVRYARIGATNEKAAKDMIDAAAILVRKL